MIKLYRADGGANGREIAKAAAKEICNADNAKILVSESGKPYFADVDLKFSISHSGERTVVAVSENEIGVDIQQKKNISLSLAKRFFTPCEQDYVFAGKDEGEKHSRFFEIWTKKEAYGKFKGCGLSGVLSEDVTAYSFYTEDDGEYSLAVYEE